MHITLEADYAIRITDYMVQKNKRLGAQEISDNTGVSLRFSLKILSKLVNSGIFKSYKGVQGGYELAKSPAEISMYDIITTIEGPYTLNRCQDLSHVCSNNGNNRCYYYFIFWHISDQVENELKKVTFDRLIK